MPETGRIADKPHVGLAALGALVFLVQAFLGESPPLLAGMMALVEAQVALIGGLIAYLAQDANQDFENGLDALQG